MSDDRWPLNRLLDVVGRPGVYQALTVLRNGDGVATFAEIDQNACPHTDRCLRTLAAEGFVQSRRSGSWDDIVEADTPFTLTDAGAELLTHLNALEAWARKFPRGAAQHRHRSC